jgi:hypothetical protein
MITKIQNDLVLGINLTTIIKYLTWRKNPTLSETKRN